MNERYVEITLTPLEIMQAAMNAVARRVQGIKKKRPPYYGCPPDREWEVDIIGSLGELVVAKCLNHYWNGNFGNLRAADVGLYQVRASHFHRNRLIVHRSDPDDRPFIFVTGRAPTFRVWGWIYGRDAKNPEFWADPAGGRPAFFVSKEHLRPMSALPDEYRYAA